MVSAFQYTQRHALSARAQGWLILQSRRGVSKSQIVHTAVATVILNRGRDMSEVKGMDKQQFFDALFDMLRETDVDFLEIYVGDELEDEICVKFDNISN